LDEEDEDEPSQPQSSGKAPSSRYKIKESTGRRSEARHSVTRQSEIYYEPDASQEPALIEDIPWEEVAADVAVPVVNYSHTAAFTDPDLLETGGRARAYIAGKPEAPIEQELDPSKCDLVKACLTRLINLLRLHYPTKTKEFFCAWPGMLPKLRWARLRF
jgi:hypothetical protein